jgi:hypothetical protein
MSHRAQRRPKGAAAAARAVGLCPLWLLHHCSFSDADVEFWSTPEDLSKWLQVQTYRMEPTAFSARARPALKAEGNMKSERFLALIVWPLMLGCINDSTNLTPATGTATLSGAISAIVSVSAWSYTEPDATYLWFTISSAGEPELVFESEIPGTSLQAATFTSANVTLAQTTVTVSSIDAGVWLQEFDSSTSLQQGEFTLRIVSAGPGATGGTVGPGGGPRETFYGYPQGTLTAILPPGSTNPSAEATTVNITFSPGEGK